MSPVLPVTSGLVFTPKRKRTQEFIGECGRGEDATVACRSRAGHPSKRETSGNRSTDRGEPPGERARRQSSESVGQ